MHQSKLFFLFLLIGLCVSAQEYEITGKVIDRDTQEPLEASTVYVESVRDSSMVAYTITDQNGDFVLDARSSSDAVNLFITYNGYKPNVRLLKLDQKKIAIGSVALELQAEQLEGVSVVGERIPLVIKKDTLEFNADSFKTRPDSNVEDVLKKLPGIEIDTDGTITVNGKEVDKVLVNGQEFFSSDPKVATKSLPKEIIDKIQITDSKTKTQEFTGEEGDGETKTINLTIKEDKNKGYLGRLAAGYGTDDRYQVNGIVNYFNNKERISVLVGSNNINNAGFSFDEIYDMVGNSRGGYSFASSTGLINNFGRGITTSSTAGASYANAKKGAYEIGANYFFAYSDSYNNQKTSRENILPEGSFFTDSESRFDGSTNSNRGAGEFEFDVDKTLRISVEPVLSVNRTNSYDQSTTTSTDLEGNLSNSNERSTVSDGMQRSFSNRIDVLKKLDTLGKFVRLTFRNSNSINENESNFVSTREIFGDQPSEETLNQMNYSDNKHDNYSVDLGYRQPLSKSYFLDFGYSFNTSSQINENSVYDLDGSNGEYGLFNETLSTNYEFDTKQQRPSLGIRKEGEKFRFRFQANYVLTDLSNNDFLHTGTFDRNYENLNFEGMAQYKFNKNLNLRLRYGSDVNAPSVGELQPVRNISNPLNVVTGNPDLGLEQSHRFNLNLNNFNWKDRTGFFIYMGAQIQEDKVVRVTSIDEDLLRTTTFDNVDGNFSFYAGVGYSKQIKKDSTYTIKINFDPNINYNNDVSFVNDSKLTTKRLSVSPRIGVGFNFAEIVEIEPNYGLTYNNTKYSLDTSEDQNFISHRASLRATTYWPENIVWGNDFNYTYNGNVSSGYDKDVLFWNMSLGAQFLKDKLLFKVLAYDLLNQNNNSARTTGADYIQDYQSTVLQRYFMASVTIKFDKFGGKGKPDSGGRMYRIR